MKIIFWGVRGSIPSPIKSVDIGRKITEVLKRAADKTFSNEGQIKDFVGSLPSYLNGTTGGNTSCVEIRTRDQIIVLDAGTGIRELGHNLMTDEFARGNGTLHLFMSHTHWDHIMGFPFFLPAFIKGNSIHIYGCHANLEERFRDQHDPAHFPVHLESLSANVEFHVIKPEEDFFLGDCKITPIALRHPGVSYGFRIENDGKKIIYATDSEYKDLSEKGLKRYLEFFHGCDILIFDAMYTLADALEKEDWGHSSSLIGAEIAMEAKIKTLVLYHHEPTHDDLQLNDILKKTINFVNKSPRYKCEVVLGHEGLELDI